MLEPLGAELLSATEALAAEEAPIQIKTQHQLSMYFSVIVTTARLHVCIVDPSAISLSDGKFMEKDAKIVDCSYLRFHKQLSHRPSRMRPKPQNPFDAMARGKERTVFVATADKLTNFLKNFEVDNGSLVQQWESGDYGRIGRPSIISYFAQMLGGVPMIGSSRASQTSSSW